MKRHTKENKGRFLGLSFPRGLPLLLLQAFLLTAAAVIPLLTRLELSLPPFFLLAVFAGPLLVYAALSPFPKLRILLYPIALLSVLTVAFFSWTDFQGILSVPISFSDLPAALSPVLRPLVFILSILISVTALSLGEVSCFPMGIAVACFSALLAPPAGPSDLILPGMALALSACPPGRAATRALPMVLLSFAIAGILAMSPLSSYESPELRESATEILDGARDRLFYTDARMPFSLSSLGWQPLGADYLGGSASPSDTPILEVRTTETLYLRGAIHSEYDGHAFSDPVPGSRYLLTDPRYRRLRDTLFDRSLPKGALRSGLPQEENVTVRLLADGAGTLFVTGRFDGLSGEGLVLYHSGTGEIFATRSLAEGDTYVFRGIPITGSDSTILSLAEAAERKAGEAPDLSDFLTLPATVEPEVFRLASVLTADVESTARKAERLVWWLSTSYPYSLEQNVPPANREFVSWFLLSERRGSCTSFAAALVVLARCAGLPARYCEGFSAEPDPDGIAVLTGWNAHAWAEIYLPGLGWTPFDATPPNRNTEEDSSGSSSSPTQPTLPQPDVGIDDSTFILSMDPETSAEPIPAASQEPPTEPTAPSHPGLLKALPHILSVFVKALVILLFLSAAAFTALLYLTSPERLAKSASPKRALRIWYDACRALLTENGLPPLPSEAPGSYLHRMDTTLPGLGFASLSEKISHAFYSKTGADKEDVTAARRVYHALRKSLTLRERLRARMRFAKDMLQS